MTLDSKFPEQHDGNRPPSFLTFYNAKEPQMCKTTRTTAYRFTVQMKDGQPVGPDAEAVKDLREFISFKNKTSDIKRYVKLQGRGHRRGVYRYNQSLPLQYASYADVYVYNR